jgi:hypothetical protein
LKFLFGTEPVTWNFTEDGTFDVSFTDDWNLITRTSLVSSISEVYDIADLNRDGIVDMYDAIALSISFDSRVGDTNWNPRADLNFDQQIDRVR